MGSRTTVRAFVGALSLATTTLAQDATITWKEEQHTTAELAQWPGVAETAAAWSPFAEAHGYRLVLDPDARVLLVLSDTYARDRSHEHREVGVMLDLVAETSAAFARALEPDGFEGADASEGVRPVAPVVVICAKSDDYPALLDHAAAIDERLTDWTSSAARRVAGFVLSDPLIAAWIEDPQGVSEWHPYNELVHRTAQLLIRQRHPNLPPWLLLGLAWHIEDEVRACIYCFPHRAGFVSAASHTDWGLWLANHFKKSRRRKNDKPADLGLAEFASWRPHAETDEFETGKAYVAFGVARYLACEHPEALPALASKLDERITEGRQVWISATEWRLDTSFELPLDQQRALLEEVDPEITAKLARWFRAKKANRVRQR